MAICKYVQIISLGFMLRMRHYQVKVDLGKVNLQDMMRKTRHLARHSQNKTKTEYLYSVNVLPLSSLSVARYLED